MAETWRLKVRDGPRVEKAAFGTLEAALDELRARTVALAAQPKRGDVDLKVRRFDASEVVVARVELRGPQRWVPRVRAGMDVHADRSVEPWIGGGAKSEVEPEPGEAPWDALRRALGARGA